MNLGINKGIRLDTNKYINKGIRTGINKGIKTGKNGYGMFSVLCISKAAAQ